MHTASTEHHKAIDTAQISQDAKRASLRDQLEQAEREGNPVVMLGPDLQDGPTTALVVIALIVMAIGCAAFGLLCWITGSIRGGIFVTSLLLIIGAFIYAWNDRPNNGEVKL